MSFGWNWKTGRNSVLRKGSLKMEKNFLDVFPNLEMGQELAALLEEVVVTKVAVNPEKDHIRIYIRSRQWIHKKYIYSLEETIRNQFFPGVPMSVKIIEKFTLTGQYTPKLFFDAYRTSMSMELKNYSILVYNMFRTAQITFPEEQKMELKMQSSVLAKSREEELVSYIEKVFCERCPFSLIVEPEYVEASESKVRKNSEIRIMQEAAHVIEQSSFGQQEEGGEVPEEEAVSAGETSKEEKKADAPAGKTSGEEKKAPKDRKEDKGKDGKGRKSFGKGDRGFGDYKRSIKRSDNPDVIYGRDSEDETIPLESIQTEMGEVCIRGQIMTLETREIRNEKTIIIFAITDFTDSITVKMFARNDQVSEILEGVKEKAFLKLKGVTTIDRYDSELTIGSVVGIKKIAPFTSSRADTSPEKRVELHCHTKMSDMDGVSDAKAIIKRAYEWGHRAIAITDHGVVQAFPEANHCFDSWGGVVPPDADFKVIYGVEAYLVDDMKGIVQNSKGQSMRGTFVVFDIETTGFSALRDKIIEIGAVRVEDGKIVGRFSEFVNPRIPIPFRIEKLTSINDSMVAGADSIDVILPRFVEFCRGAVMVAHNAEFDMSFIEKNCGDLGIETDYTSVDTVGMARFLLPQLNRFKLDTVAKAVGVSLEHHHRAVDDAECTAQIFQKFITMCEEREISTLDELNEKGAVSVNAVQKMPTYHAIILAKNDTGRVNLYHLVSDSHLIYYHRRPRIPKSLYLKYQEGLMIGSACEAGELYQAVLNGRPEPEIARLVNFYDYLEIQPIGNNAFMLRDEDRTDIQTEDDLREVNRKIVKLGEMFNKPVVATCDVHFLDPSDEVYRRIIMAGKGFDDADLQPPLFLHTTGEMLEEFSYLGSEKAEEVVITNPNRIADMVEKISPIHKGKCPPVIENSDEMLREICYSKAHEIYGEKLPKVVEERLERELNSIISNGYAVMYMIAQKLVWKSNSDGYLVGSRGSVGSSFAATMSGITEVNPLSPHYYCPSCHYCDFDSDEVRAYSGRAGCDMPDKNCPVCGKPLTKEGFDIPFETFLGFKGDKEPDIDLNFSGDYQGKAHRYVEVIFGAGQTFKAGTIGTLAEKTAFGYVKNYFEERGSRKRYCEINRIVQGCTGVRRTTGQHPGGIIVLPIGWDIEEFTPVQHPANDMSSDIITTHFDYHSIDSNLLKLDILGHDDPTMIRMLEDLTGINAREIPLDSKEVMSLFKNTDALGVTPDDIRGCPLGCLGVPEFGTDFAMQMLIDANPTSFSDLVRISGLSHGTDVWLGNAQDLIKSGTATITTCICTRDDIMIYLINKGLEHGQAFTIMESVRKGKGLKPEWIDDMKAHDVPDWYIDSCKKIKYMFPKAHAAAYVMMGWRIAYCKIYYPLAYYAAFFSIRATAFSYELMCQGKEKLEYFMDDYEKRKDTLSKKEQDTYRDMKIVQEMYARGFEFVPIDLYKANAHTFQIMEDKLMPALDTIEGLGDRAADAVVLAAEEGEFLSKDDFRNRTKVSKTVIDLMDDLGLFGDLPDSNQMSLFDFQ